MAKSILVNRAPVLTLWGAVVAERLGFDREAALSLGKCLSGLNAQAKGRSLGIFGPSKAVERGVPKKAGLGEEFWVEVCGRPLPAKTTEDGIFMVINDKPIDDDAVREYLEQKLDEDLQTIRNAFDELAAFFTPEDLRSHACSLYEQFRPQMPPGRTGWGAKGQLDLEPIRSLRQARPGCLRWHARRITYGGESAIQRTDSCNEPHATWFTASTAASTSRP